MNEVAAPPPFVDAAVLAPLGEGAPAGRDVTYEAHFERLAGEVEKLTSLTGETPDWPFVRREASRILREETKDLKVATWWVAATAQSGSWSDLAQALASTAAVLSQFWAEMYPPIKRARARGALVSWMWEALAKSLPTKPVTLADGDAVRAFDAAARAIDGTLQEKLGDGAPTLGPLRAVLRDKVASIPEPAPALPEVATTTGVAANEAIVATKGASAAPLPASLQAPLESAPVASLEEADAAARRFQQVPLDLAFHVRRAAPTSPWPYRLARVAAWLALETAPAVENGKTFARAPRPADRNALAQMFNAGQWEGLRNAAEDALSENALWLDLHRYTAIALERLGPTYAPAREALGREVASLLARLPGLASLTFANGTPFASPETSDWLTHECARYGGGASGAGGAGADDGLTKLVADGDARVAAGQVDEGIALVLRTASAAPTARARFRGRLAAAQMAHRSGKSAVAQAILERLLPEIDATLEAWEPAICAEMLETSLKVERSLSPDGGDRQVMLFRRLLQLDPAAALRNG